MKNRRSKPMYINASMVAFATVLMLATSSTAHAAFVSQNNHATHHQMHSVEILQPSTNRFDNVLTSNHRPSRQRRRVNHISGHKIQPMQSSSTQLYVKSLRDLMDSTSKSGNSGSANPSTNNSYANINSNRNPSTINMNHGPDIKTMGVAEIKRELELYGIKIDDFLEKRELESTLLRERQLRGGGNNNNARVAGGGEKVHVVPGVGNIKGGVHSNMNGAASSSAVSTQLNMSTSSSDGGYVSQTENNIDPQQQSPTSGNSKDSSQLRELQIAYEFERVQSALPTPTDIRAELESKFNISTKYFLGTTEMAYALAVARVDDMIERQRLGLDDGCIIDYGDSSSPISQNRNDNTSDNGYECNEDEMLPTPEELIAMEYENLQPWDEISLSEELESQYGIPAKHFMGKKEMAYALAVERVDRAMKEGGMIIDDYEEDVDSYSVMTDEDMMRLMEEEMLKEEEEEQRDREYQQQQSRGETIGGTNSVRSASSSPSPSSSSGKSFKVASEEPNPFQKKSPSYQSTPLADMIKTDKKKQRQQQPNRTPISSEPPHSFSRSRRRRQSQSNRQNSVQMGNVIGGPASGSSSTLTDILKGSEQQQNRARGRAAPGGSRIPKVQQRPPRSKTFKTSSAQYDDSFRPNVSYNNSRGYSSGWNKGPINAAAASFAGPSPNVKNSNRGYSTTWNNKGPSQYAATASSGRRKSTANAQRPFEPAPFTEPGTHNAQGSKARREPKRVPPSTPFTSPVTDGARRTSQGPYTPFTPPGKRSTNGKPPPRKRPVDPRGFNIKDTPDDTQPFVGSQYFDQNVYSPPLQVEPPPRDPNYTPPERPFEPAPFSNPQPHSVRTGRTNSPRDKWNRVNAGSYDRQQYQKQEQQQQQRQNKKKRQVSSPFDKVKDMFSNMSGRSKKEEEEKGEEQTGFKSGNVEVFSTPASSAAARQEQQAVDVEIIDAEMMDDGDWESEEYEYDEDVEAEHVGYARPPSSAERFSNAWRGGPASTTVNGMSGNEATSYNPLVDDNNPAMTNIVQQAQELLTSNTEIRAIVTRAQSNPKLRQAVQDCVGNPTAFGQYLEDPEIGPILNELKQCLI